MSLVKRAMTGIIRKPGRTLILLVIIFVLGNIIAGAVSIQQAVTNAQLALRAKMSPVASIRFDSEKYSALLEQNPTMGEEIEDISIETLERIGALPYVKYFDYSARMPAQSSSLLGDFPEGWPLGLFRFTGVHDPEIIDMKEGLIRLVSGRVFTEQETRNLAYVALIPQEMAEMNNLLIGSVITFEYGFNSETGMTRKFDFEIIGIFEVKTMEREFENGIYTPNRVLKEMKELAVSEAPKMNPDMTEAEYKSIQENSELTYSVLFILNDPMNLEAFRADVAALVPAYYTVTAVSSSFEKAMAPLESIQEITTLVLYVAAVAAALTMNLLITLFLRDRKQEIGIYLSLGERKFKVAGQILVEVAIIALIAITLSLFTGNALSGAISDQMLTDQIIADQADEDQYLPGEYAYRYQGVTDTEDLAASYAVSLDTRIIFLFYAIGFATICVSVLLPIFYITRLNPKKILMGGELEL